METWVSRYESRRYPPPEHDGESGPPGRASDSIIAVPTRGRAVVATPFFLAPVEA